MDDTIGFDESGIPALSSVDDIPVHSTPIKGAKVPLPSTKHMMKHLMKKPNRRDEYNGCESLQSIRDAESHPQQSSRGTLKQQLKPQNQYLNTEGDTDQHFRGQGLKNVPEGSSSPHGYQDISNRDNLRPRIKEHPSDKAFHHERASSPALRQRSFGTERFSNNKAVSETKYGYIEVHKESRSSEKLSGNVNGLYSAKDSGMEKEGENRAEIYHLDESNNAYSSSRHRKYIFEDDDSYTGEPRKSSAIVEVTTRRLSRDDKAVKIETRTRISGDLGNELDRYSKGTTSGDEKGQHVKNKESGKSYFDENSFSEKKGAAVDSPKVGKRQRATLNGSLSTSRQNSSFCELENTTLQKQRQEIQLLMTELKDRDSELCDMAAAHQQQLLAWEQDRQRLSTLDKKCMQFEEELRTKTGQLRTYVASLKALKSKEVEWLQDVNNLRATVQSQNRDIDRLRVENDEQKKNASNLKGTVDELSKQVGGLKAREEELVSTIRTKEKDMSSATSQMRQLGERLQQLDLRCKECQDREREAVKQSTDWKHKYEDVKQELGIITGELEKKRREAARLAEENRSARQQLALVQKEAAMMEKCKDEVIESIKIKQERTDSQLKNFRELYERQLKEVASLQLRLDTSKEAEQRQQQSCDEQQLNGSYQGRNSQMSDYSWERSTAGQRQNQSSKPVHPNREPDTEIHNSQHTQSSGYQSQLSENQPMLGAWSQQGLSSRSYQGNQSQGHLNRNLHVRTVTSLREKNRLINSSYDKNSSLDGSYSECLNKNEVEKKSQAQGTNLETSPVQPRSYLTDKYLHSQADNSETETYRPKNVEREVKHFDCDNDTKNQYSEDRSRERQSTSPGSRRFKNKTESPRSAVKFTLSDSESPFLSSLDRRSYSPLRQEGYIVEERKLAIHAEKSTKSFGIQGTTDLVKDSKDKSTEQKNIDSDRPLSNSDKLNSPARPARDFGTSKDYQSNGQGSMGETQTSNSPGTGNKFKDNVRKSLEDDFREEFNKQYTFENKLSSFLEDLEDIDDNIWDENPPSTINMSHISVGESSPASKLRKLLVESHQMIESLEKSTGSPRLTAKPEFSDKTAPSSSSS